MLHRRRVRGAGRISGRGSGAAGFTLAEALVVVAIIALLASLMMPVLREAKERSRLAQCTSNLRQIGQAVSLYLVDWEGPPTPIEALHPDYVADERLFVCASDRWLDQGGWLTYFALSTIWNVDAPPFPVSYGYFPVIMNPPLWEYASRLPNAGYMVDMLHGELRPGSSRVFQGRMLRLGFDGSVTLRQYHGYPGVAHGDWHSLTDEEGLPSLSGLGAAR